MKHKKLFILIVVMLALFAAGWIYVADNYDSAPEAVAAMSSAAGVKVAQDGDMLAFIPEEARAGFIFYPGGKVEHTAYAPMMRALADEGVLCVIIEMPLRLAVLDINAADGIMDRYTQVDKWFIGGHSLGGSMAASYAAKHAGDYAGLVLLASYSTADLKDTGLQVISIYGSEDGVLNSEKYADNLVNLPDDYEEFIIEGGCHAGFGCYGLQDGDGIPGITTDEQISAAVRLILDMIND